MTVLAFDTHAQIKQLVQTGVPEAQAEAFVNVVAGATVLPDVSQLATKADLALLKGDLAVGGGRRHSSLEEFRCMAKDEAHLLPARPLFESDRLGDDLDAARADAEARIFACALASDGVARIDLGEEGRALCDRVVADTERYFERQGVSRVQDAWLRSRAVRRLATHPEVTRLLALAYGRAPFAFQTLNFQRGTEQETHADVVHFHSAPERFMCGVWTALEDISPDAGPLSYRPGSHTLSVLTMAAAGVNHSRPTVEDYRRTYVPVLAGRLDAAGLPHATAVLKKGEALVWAANLAHGGAPITDAASTRRSLVTHFFFEQCLYYTPMRSDEASGRLALRLPVDVAAGSVRWPRQNGRWIRPGLREAAGAARKILMRRMIVS